MWKDNLIVDGNIITFEGFLDLVFCFNKKYQAFDVFRFPLIHVIDPKDVFRIGLHLDKKHFPKHYFFANFKCLRCGLCCKNYECVPVDRELVLGWMNEKRNDILQYCETYNFLFLPELYPRGMIGCPMCRKVTNKPYYYCRIQEFKEGLPVCKAYICSKSIPVAHLNFEDVDELIRIIGIEKYYSLIEKDWGELFDFEESEIKTHKKWRKKKI